MTRQILRSLVALTFVSIAAGCGKAAEEQQAREEAATTMKDGANQMAQGAATVAEGLDQMAKSLGGSETVAVLPFEKLGEAFPEVGGWKRGEITGSTMNMPFAMSQSEVTYESGEAQVELEVVDTALNQMMVAPFSMYLVTNYSERTSDGYRKGTTVKGEPAFEEVSTSGKTATITVVVGKRFIIHARGSNVPDVAPARAVLDKMDFGKLTSAR